jgi:hypothetical protein
MLRCLVFSLLFHCASCLCAQHASLHWYNLRSVAPLDQSEGKIALTRMKQLTTDTIATFTDRGDYFQLATKTPIDWQLFNQTMSDAGYFIADVTRTEVHHQDYVKMGLAYQEAYYLAEHPELCATWTTTILLNEEEWASFDADKQSFIQNHPNHFLIK